MPGTLALFTIVSVGIAEPDEPGAYFRRAMDFLVDQRGLDPEKMLFVSTDMFQPYRDQFAEAASGRFLERSRGEAQTAGDGSGLFAPKDHPQAPDSPTVGVYYPLAGTAQPTGASLTYPPIGYLEIAEIGLSDLDQTHAGPESGGLGLERLAMAEGNDIPDFEETRLNLLRVIEDETEQTGKPLPPGYTMFASL